MNKEMLEIELKYAKMANVRLLDAKTYWCDIVQERDKIIKQKDREINRMQSSMNNTIYYCVLASIMLGVCIGSLILKYLV